MVSVALGMADSKLNGLAGRSAVVIGAGAMGALSAKHLVRAGVERVHIVNRTLPRAKTLADKIRELGVAADAFPFDHLHAGAHRCRRRRQLHRRRAARWCRSPTCTAAWRMGRSRSSW